MRLLLSVLILFGVVSFCHGDAIERLRPEKLRATHERIEALKNQRREVKLKSGYDDVRTHMHVHSMFSHDSRSHVSEIIAGAKESGARVILFNEHPGGYYDYVNDGHRGLRDGVLLIPGAESNGFLAYPKKSLQNQKTSSPQEFADLVLATGGQIYLCHLEERMDWEIQGLTGSEIYNTHADFMDEPRFLASLRSPVTLLTLMGTIKQYPQEVFGALMDYPADYLARYDQLCQKSRLTGVSANDAHHNQSYRATVMADGKVQVEDALGAKLAVLDPEKIAPVKLLVNKKQPGDVIFDLDLDPYPRSFRHVSTHLLMHEVTEENVWEALREGRAYVAFDWLADPTGFVYLAEIGEQNAAVGSEVKLQHGLRLKAEAPLEGRIKLIRNGEVILDQRGAELDFAVEQPGVYRVEVWLTIAAEDRPWILTNPIYVKSE